MTQGALAGKTLTYISAGSDDACALDTRGKAYCWGADGDDELGNGETSNSKVPVAHSPAVRWLARPSLRSAPTVTTRARWTPLEPSSAGVTIISASSARTP